MLDSGSRPPRGAAGGSSPLRSLPGALSAVRLFLGPAYVLSLEMSAELPLVLALLAAASDFVDGRIARRLGTSSPSGAILDVVADGVFVVCALAALAAAGVVSRALPAAVLLSLAGFALSARRRKRTASVAVVADARRGPADRAGHYAGIANYGTVLVASAAVAGWIEARWLLPASVAVAVLNVAPLLLRAARR